jgi:hypothetical protein
MGAWGTGNFENDMAVDFVASTVSSPLIAQLRGVVDNPTQADPRGWESNRILAAAETLAIICESIPLAPPPTPLVEECRHICLREWDAHIDACDPDPAYKVGRRAVIEKSFERLLAVCRLRDQSVRQTKTAPRPPQPTSPRLREGAEYPSWWEITPEDDVPFLSIPEVLERLAAAFPVHEFDAEAGRAHAAQRLAELTEAGDAPPSLLQKYGGEPPVHVRLADAEGATAALEFYVWPNRFILVSFESATQEEACFPLLERFAEVLGYLLTE